MTKKEQLVNEELIAKIYTPEKKKIWDKEMDEAGKKFVDGKMSLTEYMKFREELRIRLGYPR